MKTKSATRVGTLAGLFVLAAIALMAVAVAAQASVIYSTGTGSGTSSGLTQLQRAHGGFDVPYRLAGSSTSAIAQLPTHAQVLAHQSAGTTDQRALAASALSEHRHGGLSVPYAATASGTNAAVQSGISSTTVWIIVAAVAGALLIGTWAFFSRRRMRHEAAPGCESSVVGC